MATFHSDFYSTVLPFRHVYEYQCSSKTGLCFFACLVKRGLDIIVSIISLVLLSPMFVLVAILIKMDTDGPVLFKQERTGQNGKVFHIFKFRTMAVHHDIDVAQATKNDPRVTGIGRILRKTSIDELPQLINILLGSMSLVGPRPHAVAHDEFYASQIPGYTKRFAVKPGLTGLAQIQNLRGETETLEKMVFRVEADLDYIRTRSLFHDLMIIFKTPGSLLVSETAY